jgi:phospholipase/carboxylesterase
MRRRNESGRGAWPARALLLAMACAMAAAGACGGGCEGRSARTKGGVSSPPSSAEPPSASLRSHRVGTGSGRVVVLLHGFGAPGDDLVGLARNLDVPAGTRFVLPEAPIVLPRGGRAWWHIDESEIMRARLSGKPRDLSAHVPDGLEAARQAVLQFLEATARELGVAEGDMVLGGFSQGAMLALDVSLHMREPPAAVAVLSGAPLTMDAWAPRLRRLRGVPVLVSHGRADELLSFDAAERLAQQLRSAGAEMRWIPFPGGHGISPAVRAELSTVIAHLSSD